MKNYLRRLWRKETWVKIHTKAGKDYVGQIDGFTKEFFRLGYSREREKRIKLQ